MKVRQSIEIEGNVIVRTVTYHYTGHIEAVTDDFIVLSQAAWVADSGRWGEALRTGTLSEVEAYPDDIHPAIARGSIVEISSWPHELPRETK